MRQERDAVRARADGAPVVDDEREVDVGRYFDTLIAHWWLPVLGLLAGVALGLLISASSKDVWRAQATVYAGAPYATSTPITNSLATNQSTITRVVKSEDAISDVAQASGMTRKKLREGISTQRLPSGQGRLVPSQLYLITVKGDDRAPTQRAARLLADRVVARVGGYADAKIAALERNLESLNTQLTALENQSRETQRQLGGPGLSNVESLVLINTLQLAEQRRAAVEQDRTETLQFLALANEVEKPRALDRAVAVKTTARSTRNTVAIAGFLGLLLGIFAALLWEPITSRAARD
jgi:uncharacterized protein involved in exopolysaccharide biosynthesis